MKVLVCGGRNFSDRNLVWRTLHKICDEFGLWFEPDDYGNTLPTNITIVHGGAKGADLLADHWAVCNWVPIKEYKADWDKYGRSAGHIRNQQMLDEEHPDLVVAFPGGRGTANMIERAQRAGIEVRIVK